MPMAAGTTSEEIRPPGHVGPARPQQWRRRVRDEEDDEGWLDLTNPDDQERLRSMPSGDPKPLSAHRDRERAIRPGWYEFLDRGALGADPSADPLTFSHTEITRVHVRPRRRSVTRGR